MVWCTVTVSTTSVSPPAPPSGPRLPVLLSTTGSASPAASVRQVWSEMAPSVSTQTDAETVRLLVQTTLSSSSFVLSGVCTARRGGRFQGFDGYKLNLEKDKSYILSRVQQTVVVQLDTKACTRNVGVCFRSILITVNGTSIDISIEPGDSEVRCTSQECLVFVLVSLFQLRITEDGIYQPLPIRNSHFSASQKSLSNYVLELPEQNLQLDLNVAESSLELSLPFTSNADRATGLCGKYIYCGTWGGKDIRIYL